MNIAFEFESMVRSCDVTDMRKVVGWRWVEQPNQGRRLCAFREQGQIMKHRVTQCNSTHGTLIEVFMS